ncbi:MAG: hypothetical protein WB565_17900 [Acidimicrobiales bacterium]
MTRFSRTGASGSWGTFDPIHRAHLTVAESARTALGLDRVLLVVTNELWQKEDGPVAQAEVTTRWWSPRAREWPGLEPSRIEINRGERALAKLIDDVW